MTDDRIEKIRAEVERLKESGCASPIVICDTLLSFIDSMEEEPKKCMYSKDDFTDEDRKVLCEGCEEDCLLQKASQEVTKDKESALEFLKDAEIVDENNQLAEPYREEPSIPDIVDENYFEMLGEESTDDWFKNLPHDACLIQYASREDGIKANAEEYSFNIESELFNQLTKEQQELWRKEIEQAVISGGHYGVEIARDKRYKENQEPVSEELEEALRTEYEKGRHDALEEIKKSKQC